MSVLTLPLKTEYFDAIRNGSKVEEFRLATPYWERRLAAHRTYDSVVLTKGYPKRADQERRIYREWRGAVRKTIQHPHFGPDPVEVFAIWVGSP